MGLAGLFKQGEVVFWPVVMVMTAAELQTCGIKTQMEWPHIKSFESVRCEPTNHYLDNSGKHKCYWSSESKLSAQRLD